MFKNNRSKRNSMPLTGIDLANHASQNLKSHQSTLIHVASRAIGVSEIERDDIPENAIDEAMGTF